MLSEVVLLLLLLGVSYAFHPQFPVTRSEFRTSLSPSQIFYFELLVARELQG
jgi:hypothetical protein